MALRDIAAALERVESVFRRRPEAGLHDDAQAIARWDGGTRVVSSHANGRQVLTDMPSEFGGSGDQVTPGWLFRAGLASCLATRIAMAAAAEGIELIALEVTADSRTDARGLLGMPDVDGSAVSVGPRDVQLRVRIAAPAVAPQRLRALVEGAQCLSPITHALQNAVPMALHIEVDAGDE